MPRKYSSMQERIEANSVIDITRWFLDTPCRAWTGKTRPNNTGTLYGYLTVRERGKVKNKLVHRMAFKAYTGRHLPRDKVGKHLCNNTLCCEITHIRGGTQASNVQQCVREGRHFTPFRTAA